MSWMAAIFQNRDEQRLRALWRLLLQLLLLLIALLVGGSIGLVLPQTALLNWISNVGVMVAAVIAVWAACRVLDLRPFADLGLRLNRAWWSDFACGLALGALLMTAVFFAALAAGWIECRAEPVRSAEFRPLALALLMLSISYVAVGLGEEVFFRGYQLRNLAEGFNCRWIPPRVALWLAAILTSALFAAAHAHRETTSLLSWINTTLGGLLLAIMVIYTGRLALPIGFHITWNFFQGGVYGFSVSGDEYHVALLTTESVGPTLWTGGAHGPEGGLLGTAACTAGIVFSVAWVRVRYGAVHLKTDWAEYPWSKGLARSGSNRSHAAAQDASPSRE